VGAVIVVTPQDVPIQDAKKAIVMLDKVNVSVLGVIENMCGFVCPKCKKASYVFSKKKGVENSVTL